MEITNQRVLLTGASGGLGRPLAQLLINHGASLIVVGRNAASLEQLQQELAPGAVECVSGDITDASFREQLATQIAQSGGIDLLINLAGTNTFRNFEAEDPQELEAMFQTNLIAPVLLTRALLPDMLQRGRGHIVNIGSILGSLGMPYFTSYCATKAGLQRFSEALRRELADTPVGVTYVAPRAVKTAINSDAVYRMAKATSMTIDEPGPAAAQIFQAIEKELGEAYLGWPEKLFMRINALFPSFIDRATAKQSRETRRFAVDDAAGQ
ncbi:MAG: SDR family oxidoreductase [Immundisolibacteraceae bacterium]|nr:SDR family oxidoreductase [Immundisolibacteraceae bacterium]